MHLFAFKCSRGGHENVAKTKMSKVAEVELNPPANADGDGSEQSGSPAKPDPKEEATKKAIAAMYDSMVPLSGKKSRKDSDDDTDDNRTRRRGRGQGQRQTPAAEESPEATTDIFKKDNGFFFCMLFRQTSGAICF